MQKGRDKEALMMCEERGVPIVIEILHGTDLVSMDDNGFSDPYVTVSMLNQQKRTVTVEKTLNPNWETSLLFTIPFEQVPLFNDAGYPIDKSHLIGLLTDEAEKLQQNKDKQFADIDAGGEAASPIPKKRKESRRNSAYNTGWSQFGRMEINFKVYDWDEDEEGIHYHFFFF